MKKKKLIFLFAGVTLIVLIATAAYLLYIKNGNLIKLDYNEIVEKVENKESFVLCVSASDCVHCQEYKPKLKKIANTYDIKIYYINIDEFNDEDEKAFKERFSFDKGTPTTIFFKDGEEKTTATRIEGNTKIEKIINKFKSNGFISE